MNEAIGTGDGAITDFQLVKIYSSNIAVSRIVTKPVAGTVKIYVDSVLQSSGVSVDTTTGIVTFTTAPILDAVITADFEFDVPVRFDTDELAISMDTGGEVVWTSGNNSGRRMEVKEFASTQVVLALPMGKSIQVGDTFDIITGCDKTRETCQSKFSNIINFRGEPDVPGVDKLLTTAGTLDKTNRNG